jgi:hypothetical protein
MVPQLFSTLRGTPPDDVALLSAVKAALGNDPTLGLSYTADPTRFVVTKATAWLAAELTAVQAAIEGAPALTPQVVAQRAIDAMLIYDKARDLALIDQLNVIRAALPAPKPDITIAQALAAIRAKAGTL